jgi:dehydrogenase/reductase SDR family protein 7B
MSYFSGKKIWITGASSGIGEQLVYELAKQNATLIISSRRKEELERVRANTNQPNQIYVMPFDQGDMNSIDQAVKEVEVKFGAIDFLFNNGGISQRAEALKTSEEVERKIFEVNYFGNVRLAKQVVTKMIEQRHGHLIITSSFAGKWGFKERSTYAAAKHALHGYYESMRMEIEQHGIFITLVTPGFIATEISKSALDENGTGTGKMDLNQSKGLPADECARRILKGVTAKKFEFGVGGNEMLGLAIHRLFPRLFDKILRRQSSR